ncbi:DUF805 domain-containing protein [Brucella pseudogrignonensis]|uniref:DUF805 domain-containing protein n=1 Tax=Brucella pseudogrignonensis TaxID=419475 RepID=UPI000CFD1A57|nr:DUF805 domain-containing protein [Ochrobactrum sp. MYb237]PQZ39491.1 hypothetical protein CQ059_23260 [Brucella pseudogrignonensis]PRA41006.1 hypothetical protein CQ063_10775 [Brucella pseudogrignonensis]PRA69832.1 hypothetical protein CQ055_10660 [Brucella pseudogrignonensis]
MISLFSFRGRIGRLSYLATTIPLAFLFLNWVAWWLFATTRSDAYGPIYILRMSAFGWIVCAWPYLAAGIKRCHDRGKSGAWYVCWTTGCLGGWISAIYFQSWYAGFAGNLIALWTITEMGLLKGDPNTNKFGAPAREIGEESF